MEAWHFETRAVHAGRESGPILAGGRPGPEGSVEGMGTPVAPGIQPSSSYYFPSLGALSRAFDDPQHGYVYARHGGPTAAAFAGAVAALEGAPAAVAFASGMAAIHAALVAAGLQSGHTVVAARDLYGATQALLTSFFATQGVRVRFVDATDLEATRATVREARPRVIYLETISNPLLRLADLPALAEIAREVGALLIVDNTFASPYLCRPLEWGAGAVVHSATKYLGGHGDLTAGVAAGNAELAEPLQLVARLAGATLGAFDAWLALRGLRTLPLRMERHCANALRVARYLAGHPHVERVHYPGLETHPQHALAQRLFGGRGFGGVVSFELRAAGAAEVARFIDSLRLFLPAPTMGDVYSLVMFPAQASHRGLSAEQRAALGIGENLVRLSVGVESADDLIADLAQALARSEP